MTGNGQAGPGRELVLIEPPGEDAAAAEPEAWSITAPCIVDEMPAAAYHADPVPWGSLSSSGARRLLPPNCPAAYWEGEDEPTKRMEDGTAAHSVILGAGPGLVKVPCDSWRTNKAKDAAKQARAEGLVPVLADRYDQIQAMAARLRAHKSARRLFEPGSGLAEQSFFWLDPEFGIWRRARLDFLPWGAGGVIELGDYKTSNKADPESVRKAIARHGYHMQGAFYRDAVRAFRPEAEVRFVLVVQEITYPYLVATYQLDADAMAQGAAWNRVAMEIYRDCRKSGTWPGYDPEEGIIPIGLPRWTPRVEDWW